MFATFRVRLLAALSLTCALAPAACKHRGDVATDVDDEQSPKKPKPKPKPPEQPKAWRVGDDPPKGNCAAARFCTTRPKIQANSDASALYARCGSVASIPDEVALEGFEGHHASIDPMTTEAMAAEHPDACCYLYRVRPCGKGRPLRVEGAPVLAREVRSRAWATGFDFAAVAHAVAPDARAPFIEHLRHVALLEHASVAAFSWVSLELLSIGAEATLVEAAHVAALDEIRHARACWSLLAALGAEHGPGPMVVPTFSFDPERMLLSTLIDGCVGETVGSLAFAEAAHRCTVPELAAMYATIAEEEATHAELAFRIVQLLIDRDPTAADRLLALAGQAAPAEVHTPRNDALGLLDADTHAAVHARALHEVILPTLRALSAPYVQAA